METPFEYRLRVRYHECDGQKVVFNARYAEYVDVAALEYCRTIFAGVDAASGGLDWRLVHQSMQWKAPAVFDDVLSVYISTEKIGTTSFTLNAEVFVLGQDTLLVRAQTVYVVYDEEAGQKTAIGQGAAAKLLAGAAGQCVNCSGASDRLHLPDSP